MKEFLSRKGIKYTELDVAQNQQARDQMVKKSGRMAVPTIMVGEEMVVGFNPSALEKLLQ